MTFLFDKETHIGTLDGCVIPSVTQVLKSHGLIGNWGTPEALARGNRIDVGCQYLAEGDLDWGSVSAEDLPYLQAFEKFLKDLKPKKIIGHTQIYDPDFRFFGEFDFAIDGLLPDVKTGGPAKWHVLQGAGYWRLAGMNGLKPACLYLHPDGAYSLMPHGNAFQDWRKFQTLLSAYWIKEEYGN